MAKVGAVGLVLSLSLLAIGFKQLQTARGDSTGTCGWSCLECTASSVPVSLTAQATCLTNCNLLNGTTDITTARNDIGVGRTKVDAQACCEDCKNFDGCQSFLFNPRTGNCNFKATTVSVANSLNITAIPYQAANVCFCS